MISFTLQLGHQLLGLLRSPLWSPVLAPSFCTLGALCLSCCSTTTLWRTVAFHSVETQIAWTGFLSVLFFSPAFVALLSVLLPCPLIPRADAWYLGEAHHTQKGRSHCHTILWGLTGRWWMGTNLLCGWSSFKFSSVMCNHRCCQIWLFSPCPPSTAESSSHHFIQDKRSGDLFSSMKDSLVSEI